MEPVKWVLRVRPKLVSESENSKIGPKECMFSNFV
jgi:hypothetical protein